MLPLPFVPACLRGPYVIAIDFGVFNFCFLDRHLFLCLVWIWVCLFSCVVDMYVFVFLYVHFYRPGSRIWKYYLFSSQVAERQRYFLLSMRQAFPDAHYAEILSIANLQYEGPNYGSVKGSHTTYHITSLIISLPVTSHYYDCYHTTTQSYLHNSSSHITLSCLFILPAALKHSLFIRPRQLPRYHITLLCLHYHITYHIALSRHMIHDQPLHHRIPFYFHLLHRFFIPYTRTQAIR